MSRKRLLAQIGGASFLIGVGFVFQALADVFDDEVGTVYTALNEFTVDR